MVAGFVAGFAAMEAQPAQPLRHRISLYLTNNAIETGYRLLASAGVVQLVPRGEAAVFAFALGLLAYLHQHHRSHLASLMVKPLAILEGNPECDQPATFVHKAVDEPLLHIPKEFAASPAGYVLSGATQALLLGLIIKGLGKAVAAVKTLVATIKAKKAAASGALPNPVREQLLAAGTAGLTIVTNGGTASAVQAVRRWLPLPAASLPTFLENHGLTLFLVSLISLYRITRLITKKLASHCGAEKSAQSTESGEGAGAASCPSSCSHKCLSFLLAALPGFVAGASALFWPSVVISQFVLSQSLDSVWTAATLGSNLLLPPHRGSSILFGLSSALLLYASVWNPSAIRASTRGLLSKLSDNNFTLLPKAKQ